MIVVFETLNHHLYRVHLVAIDGTSSQFLTRYQVTYLVRRSLAEAMELRLMDRQGVMAKNLRASTRSRALLSDNAEYVAAVKGLEGCAAPCKLRFCGVLWNTVDDTRLPLGRLRRRVCREMPHS